MELDLSITFGAIAPFMSDPTIEEIWINSPERIFIARNGRSELTNLLLSSDDVRNIVERALMWSGRRHAVEARGNQRNRVMEAAGKAEVSMMIPVVFLILPISILFALWPSLTNLNMFAN